MQKEAIVFRCALNYNTIVILSGIFLNNWFIYRHLEHFDLKLALTSTYVIINIMSKLQNMLKEKKRYDFMEQHYK